MRTQTHSVELWPVLRSVRIPAPRVAESAEHDPCLLHLGRYGPLGECTPGKVNRECHHGGHHWDNFLEALF